ncbi:MAG: hypothetical protein ACTSX7_07895 [Alphaproteobacteria bacterium]
MSISMDVEIATPTQTTIYLLDKSAPATLLPDILPSWTRRLGVKSVKVAPLDVSGGPANLQNVIEFIRTEHHARGAVAPGTKSFSGLPEVVFDCFCPNATTLGVFDVITKANGKLRCQLSMPVAAGAALDDILRAAGKEPVHLPRTVLILGASASGDALALNLLARDHDAIDDVTIVDTDVKALNRSSAGLQGHPNSDLIAVRHIAHPADLTRAMAVLPEGSLIVHAGTSEPRHMPLMHGNALVFSRQAIIWDQTALGDSILLSEATREQAAQNLILADGWRFQLFLLAAEIAEILGLEPSVLELTAMVDSAERPARKRQAAC